MRSMQSTSVGKPRLSHYRWLQFILLGFIIHFTLPTVHTSAILKLQHMYANNEGRGMIGDQFESLKAHDRARHSRMLNAVVDFPLGGSSDPYIAGLYYTKVVLGTPPRAYYVQIDTGSDVLWVNCRPCNACPITSGLGISVFPYSVFYIFFEQYLDIWRTTLINLSLALGAVFIVCLAITCSLWASAMILLVLAMIILDMMGLMSLLSIQLNAISVVNLAMSAGIAVEFCVHITHAFSVSEGSRAQRTEEALTTMGASIFSGITVTKFVGVLVLCFARSEIFEVYYFRMYLSLVVLGFLHGLIFLPVFLSLCGPPSIKSLLNNDEQNDSSTSSSTEQNLGTYKMEKGQQSDS